MWPAAGGELHGGGNDGGRISKVGWQGEGGRAELGSGWVSRLGREYFPISARPTSPAPDLNEVARRLLGLPG